MSISSALKKLVTNLGGTPTKKTVEGLINEVADNVSGGGGGSGGGGDERFVVSVDAYFGNDGVATVSNATKTVEEIKQAILDGKEVCLRVWTSGSACMLYLEQYTETIAVAPMYSISFSSIRAFAVSTDVGCSIMQFSVNHSNTWTGNWFSGKLSPMA